MDEKRRIQDTLNRSLSGLKEDPYLARRVIQRAKGEKRPMKKKLSGAIILAVLLALTMMGTAYALITSRVADFFGRQYGREMGEWLSAGKVAQVGESVTIGDVSVTLDEVVYRDRGLYGVGTVRAVNEKDVMLPFEDVNWFSEEDEKEYDWFEQNPESRALVDKVRETGGRLLTLECFVQKIGVDGGEMLTPGSMGTYDKLNEDGTVTFSLEVEDSYSIEDGTTYQMELEVRVYEADEKCRTRMDTKVKGYLTVSFEPVFITEPTKQPEIQVDVSAVQKDGYDLLVPAEYRETGSLPVYQAIAADFLGMVKAEWFNKTGVAEQPAEDYIIFNDNAALMLSPEGFDYREFADREGAGKASGQIVDLVWMNEWEKYYNQFVLDKDAVNSITLAEAQAQAEDLLNRLGIVGFVCNYALDMSKERISSMGALYNEAIDKGYLMTDQPQYDYDGIPAEEEGFYLRYELLGVDHANEGRYRAIFYINRRGIVFANVRSDFLRGDLLYTPEALIAPETAVERLYQEAAKARNPENVVSIQRVALTYSAVRADNKADGMVFVPVWNVQYQDETGEKLGYTSFAEINALTGALTNASFR